MTTTTTTSPRTLSYGCLLVAGAIHALSFAPGPLPAALLPYVQLLSLATFFGYVFKARGVGDLVAKALSFGLGSFGVGVYWLYISMHLYGGLALPLAITAVVVLALAMSLFGLLAMLLARLFIPHPTALSWQQQMIAAAVLASLWTLTEWLRGTLFTGFPWLNIAYAHVDSMFAGWAPLLGAYGVAWFAAFSAAALGFFAINADSRENGRAAAAIGLSILAGAIGIALGNVKWADAYGKPTIVRLIQGNVAQDTKFNPANLDAGIALYQRLANVQAKEIGSEPRIIVLPETVIPLLQNQFSAEFWQGWINIAARQKADILLGAPLVSDHAGRPQYTNSVIGIDANTTPQNIIDLSLTQRYDKHHLVPFGEFIPTGFAWFIDMMQIPLGSFSRGPLPQKPFTIAGQRVAPNICYEDVFGEEIIQAVRPDSAGNPGASMLINVSNLAWFGDSWALRQHWQMSRMRAIETARPMLRATNTGLTGAINHQGQALASLPQGQLGILDVEVQGATGLTPYVRWANLPILIWSIFVALLGGLLLRRRNRQR